MVKGFAMQKTIAVIGAGVSGLTSAVVLAEHGARTVILANQRGTGITSAAAAAIWYPYDAGPTRLGIEWALDTFETLLHLSRDPCSGVSIVELRKFSRHTQIEIPSWAKRLGVRKLD